MPSHNLGGLSLLEEEEKKPFTYGLYQQESVDPMLAAGALQNLYGTSAMPVFEWVRTIQTGTRTYDPQDDFDNSMLEEYEKLMEQRPEDPSQLGLPTTQEIVRGTVTPIAQAVGTNVVKGMSDPYLSATMSTGKAALEGGLNTFSLDALPSGQVSELAGNTSKLIDSGAMQGGKLFAPELAGGKELAEATGNLDAWNALNDSGNLSQLGVYKPETLTKAGFEGVTVNSAEAVKAGTQSAGTGIVADAVAKPSYFQGVQSRLGAEGLKTAGVNGLLAFGVNLATGMKPLQAAKSAGASAIGAYIGQALIPIPVVGGVIGSVVGSVIGGRVICNELMRQNLMTRRQVVLDYKFTRDYLTPQHVNGYHLWAVHVVRQMRKGRFVKFWKHVAGHRANEIAYIYGERDKPDYLGKIYRKILEPTCWVAGYFCKETDWSTLYKHKEV